MITKSAYGIPNLQFNLFSINCNHASPEFNTLKLYLVLYQLQMFLLVTQMFDRYTMKRPTRLYDRLQVKWRLVVNILYFILLYLTKFRNQCAKLSFICAPHMNSLEILRTQNDRETMQRQNSQKQIIYACTLHSADQLVQK